MFGGGGHPGGLDAEEDDDDEMDEDYDPDYGDDDGDDGDGMCGAAFRFTELLAWSLRCCCRC